MSTISPHTESFNRPPLSLNDNRDENIIIDILGNWIPECDLIYYGLLNSNHSNEFPKLRDVKMINPRDVYLEHCYFNANDLIRYISSEDDTLIELDDKFLAVAIKEAIDHYSYIPCNETMLRHSIIELAYYDFVKSITLVYPWPIRPIDIKYLQSIIPHSIMQKITVVSGNLLEYIKSKTTIKYTTIICNSVSDIVTMIDNCDEYRTWASFFLLRNSSQCVSYEISNDSETSTRAVFAELGNDEILGRIIDPETGLPKSKMRFARYEPRLYSDSKPKEEDDFLASRR